MTTIATAYGSPESNEIALVPSIDSVTLDREVRRWLPNVKRRRAGRGVAVDAFDAVPLLHIDSSTLAVDPIARRMILNRERVLSRHADVYRTVEDIKQRGADFARELLHHHSGLGVLDDHQWVNVAAATIPASYGLCLFDEQGAGKTVSVVFAMEILAERREVMTTLIVAPKSMLTEWQRDIERFLGDLYTVRLLTGSRSQRLGTLSSRPDVVVANYEGLVSMEAELRNYVRQTTGRALLVADESYNVKNRDARRTRAIRRLREEFDRAFVLCGSPAPNAPHDVVSQLDTVDFGYTFRGIRVPDDRDEAVPVIREAMTARGLYTRHLKADVLPELPDKTFHRVGVELAPLQRRAYEAALDDLILDLRSTSDRDFSRQIPSYLARRATLLRLCSDPANVIDGYEETPAKLVVLDKLLEDWIANRDEKVVLWSFYRATLATLVERYSVYRPARVDGSVTDTADRREAVRRFQEDADCRLFIGNAAAAGSGLTLHSARLAIYESMSAQAAHFVQSVDRIHRRGQTREVEYVVLLCEGSIEESEFDRLLVKDRRARDLLGDEDDLPVTRASMLEELIRSSKRLGATSAVS